MREPERELLYLLDCISVVDNTSRQQQLYVVATIVAGFCLVVSTSLIVPSRTASEILTCFIRCLVVLIGLYRPFVRDVNPARIWSGMGVACG